MINYSKDISIKDCNKDLLIDLNSVIIDEHKSKSEKLMDFVNQIKNPYLFCIGDIVIKISFDDSGNSLQERMEKLILENLGK